MLAQFFETITDFDSGIWNSLIPLVFRPGFLTKEFLAGRRKRYFPPVQMYAFFSFLFFLTAFYLPDPEGEANKDGVSEALSEVFYGPAPRDGSAKYATSGSSFEVSLNDQEANSISSLFVDQTTPTQSGYDSLQAILPVAEKDNALDRFINRRLYHFGDRIRERDQNLVPEFIDNFLSNLPNLLIVLLPLFALILKLLYLRRNWFYVEHLIFAVHLHCFGFLQFTLWMLLSYFFPAVDSLVSWTVLVFLVYLFFAMKTMFGQGWIRTFVKFNLLGASYTLLLIVGLVMNLFVSGILAG